MINSIGNEGSVVIFLKRMEQDCWSGYYYIQLNHSRLKLLIILAPTLETALNQYQQWKVTHLKLIN